MEGVQELGQEWMADATNRYYKRMYTDFSGAQADLLKSGIYSSLGDVVTSKESWDAAKSQVFSPQGFQTFLSGFVMGGFIGGPKASITSLANKTFGGLADFYLKKTKSAEEYAQYKLQKETIRDQHKVILNTILSGAENYFSPKKESLYYQKKAASNLITAEDNKDDLEFYNAKDDAMLDHIMTSLNAGTFDTIIDSFDQLDKLSESELADYFNLEKGDKAKEKLQEYKSRAKEIKKRYDFFEEKFGSPFNPKRYKPGTEEHDTEFIAFKSFEDAKKAAIASQYGFDRAVERMQSIYDDLSKEKPIAKSSESDYSVLFNPKVMAKEIKLLKEEADTLSQSTDKDERKNGKQKLKKAEVLQEYLEAYNNYIANKSKPIQNEDGTFTVNYDADLMDPLKKSYAKYLNVIADNYDDYLFNDNVDSSFKKIMDYYNLDEDSKKYMQVVNHLSNPNNLLKHAERIRNTLTEIYKNKNDLVDEALNNYFGKMEFNQLLNAIGRLGVVIDPEQLLELAKNGKTPTEFYDLSTGNAIQPDDVRMDRINEILETYKTITEDIDNEKPEIVTDETEETKEPEVKKEEPTEKKEKLTTEVEDKLKQAYDQFIEDTGSDMTFDDFVETHPTAARIKSETSDGTTVTVEEPETSTDADNKVDTERRSEAYDLSLKSTKFDPDTEEYVTSAWHIPFRGDRNTGYTVIRTNTKEEIPSKLKDFYDNFYMIEFQERKKRNLKNPNIKGTKDGYGNNIGGPYKGLYENKEGEFIKIEGDTEQDVLDKINAKYDEELAILEGGKPTQTAPVATDTKVDIESEREKLKAKYGVYLGGEFENHHTIDYNYGTQRWEIRSASAKYNETKGYRDFENKIVKTANTKDKDAAIEELMKYAEEKGITIYDQKYSLGTEATAFTKENREKFDAELAALEGKSETTEIVPTEITPSSKEKIDNILNEVKSVKDMPSLKLDNGEISKKLLQLITNGDVTSDEVLEAVKIKNEEVMKNIKPSDFVKGDVITFTDGRKGIVEKVEGNTFVMKIFTDPPGLYRTMDAKDLKNFYSVKKSKEAIEEEQDNKVEVTPEDKATIIESKETATNLVDDSTRSKQIIDQAAKDAAASKEATFDDLLDGIGCDITDPK